jgi:triacylglycerol lipase
VSPRRRLLIAVAGVVVLVVLVVVGVRLLTGRTDSGARPDQATPGAVLLVPGYGGNTGSLTRLAQVLTNQGRTATVVALPDGGSTPRYARRSTPAPPRWT